MIKTVTTERIPIKLWIDDIEPGALSQAKDLANLPFAFKWIPLMPDCHRGYGMPIGGVLATREVVIPNAVGVDIGCGMVAAQLSLTHLSEEQIKLIMNEIARAIPVGFNHHSKPQDWDGFKRAPNLPVVRRELESARYQLGTLGGGNHFIEIQKGSDGQVWIMLHSGSRNFGLKVASEYHNKAKDMLAKRKYDVPNKDLAYLPLDSKVGRDYLEAMQFALDFAHASRAAMMRRACEIVGSITGASVQREVNIHHNYAAFENHFGEEVIVHRKGATKATQGLEGIIPGSMGSRSYIVKGLGNPESFMSCSHGAGRVMGRKEAKRRLDLAGEQKKMDGIVHGLYSRKGLDEAPGAYKNIDKVMANQADLVEIDVTLEPLGVIKG